MWIKCSDSPTPRSYHSTVVLGKRIYIYGGIQKSIFSKSFYHDDPDIWVYDINQKQLLKYINTKNNFSSKFLSNNLIATNGPITHSRCRATLFSMNGNLAILGGSERFYELIEFFFINECKWVHLRIKEMPNIESPAIYVVKSKGLFVIGKNNKEDKLYIGLIKERENI